ncbi:MAG: methylated-DNA--[protein]-cysteine S-methyltransferase [Lacrimispora sp.]|uniref:methylated-DNA--[protein]-cysteine S-methyltransferase n=1 Tax=Lacrimispora sp. TaxID=2719234 RepID=UPI0039E21CAE
MYYTTDYSSPLGVITLAADDRALVGLWLEGQKYFGGTVKEEMKEDHSRSVFRNAEDWLDRYFAGKKPAVSELTIAPIGGEFRQGVWEILCQIPYGQVVTYGDIARKMAEKMGRSSMSSQAVGGAVGHNPISIIIPCHRVVGTNRSLTGYAGGIDKKLALLTIEGVNVERFFIPKKGSAL